MPLPDASGLDDSHRFHDLRQTFGARAACAGVPMRKLQEWMGHRDLTTTQIDADYAPNAAESDMAARAFGRRRLSHRAEKALGIPMDESVLALPQEREMDP